MKWFFKNTTIWRIYSIGGYRLTGGNSGQYRFGYSNLQFEGSIDFNGNTLLRDNIAIVFFQ